MDQSTYLDRLGEDIEPGGRDPAPFPLRLVQQFVNTYNHELGSERDRLGTPGAATRWLTDHGLLDPGPDLPADGARRLIEFRETVRALVIGAVSRAAPAESPIDDLARRSQVRFRLGDDNRLHIEARGAGMDRAIASLLIITHEAMIDGSWSRVKACRQCAWVFFDQSRNRSGGWCSMAVCGNRVKNRSYRRRASS